MKAFVVSMLLFAVALSIVAVPANAQKDAATLTLQVRKVSYSMYFLREAQILAA